MTPAFAKNRARLLREDLAAAGIDIPHSLALELVAHQHGFHDWNTLVATHSQRHTEPYVERETYQHVSTTMTLGELRAVIAGHPDDTPVLVSTPVQVDDTSTSTIPADSAYVRASLMTDRRPALFVEGTHPTGNYLVPRRLVLKLSGLPGDGDPAVAGVIESVRAAVDELGFRGERSMGNDGEAGVVTWMFQATERVPLSAVEDAVRRVVRQHNPGRWILTTG